ncbi:hypothetical protein M422DRAFT_241374 [Sphaerobolus stellatus SS14]|nr:hypothetical protein M422DRAFT_241374 [Sphaerobolus stellatus SS14]
MLRDRSTIALLHNGYQELMAVNMRVKPARLHTLSTTVVILFSTRLQSPTDAHRTQLIPLAIDSYGPERRISNLGFTPTLPQLRRFIVKASKFYPDDMSNDERAQKIHEFLLRHPQIAYLVGGLSRWNLLGTCET